MNTLVQAQIHLHASIAAPQVLIDSLVKEYGSLRALDGIGFHVSAGERMGWKRGRLSRRHAQLLELAAPENDWERIAAIVQAMDTLKRPVRKNRRFAGKWAEAILKEVEHREKNPD